MYLSNFMVKLILYLTLLASSSFNYLESKEMNAEEIYKSCKDYYNWVKGNYSQKVDAKTLFNMGKCQGVIQTLGKTMITLCYESKRNVNINLNFTANLKDVKTMDIIEKFIKVAASDGDLRTYSYSSYLLSIISRLWPCK